MQFVGGGGREACRRVRERAATTAALSRELTGWMSGERPSTIVFNQWEPWGENICFHKLYGDMEMLLPRLWNSLVTSTCEKELQKSKKWLVCGWEKFVLALA